MSNILIKFFRLYLAAVLEIAIGPSKKFFQNVYNQVDICYNEITVEYNIQGEWVPHSSVLEKLDFIGV